MDAAAAAKSHQSCLTLCDPIDGSPPSSPVPGILKARTLEWVAISFSNAWEWKMKVKLLSHVRLLATPWTAAHQAPPLGLTLSKTGCHWRVWSTNTWMTISDLCFQNDVLTSEWLMMGDVRKSSREMGLIRKLFYPSGDMSWVIGSQPLHLLPVTLASWYRHISFYYSLCCPLHILLFFFSFF